MLQQRCWHVWRQQPGAAASSEQQHVTRKQANKQSHPSWPSLCVPDGVVAILDWVV
jgi:hypothetical protein